MGEIKQQRMVLSSAGTVLLLVTFGFDFATAAHHRFDYRKEAQELWHKHKNGEACNGEYQSPINIVSHRTITMPLPALEKVYYHDPLPLCLKNTGHSVSLKPEDNYSGPWPRIFGAVLHSEYIMESFHFHWGHRNSRGSEHVLSGIRFPLEMHIIHRNIKYPNISTALNHRDGLTVLAYFFQAREQRNDNLTPMLKLFRKLRFPGESACMEERFMLSSLLEISMDIYYTYHGSLTTPPCTEAVTWIVFPDPLYISYTQIRKFRKIHTTEEDRLLSNFRLPQRLNERIVYKRDISKNNIRGYNRTDVNTLKWYKLQ